MSDRTRASDEITGLRSELNRRILLQNTLLQGAILIFGACLLGMAAFPVQAWTLAATLNVALLAAAAQWCHHGVRTAQIVLFLQSSGSGMDGWERWLRANRPPTLLGSRWMISTKGVFLGLGASAVPLAIELAPEVRPLAALTLAASWALSAALLFTNPKE